MGPATALPAGKLDLVSSVSVGGDVAGSSLIASSGGQKPVSELPSTHPSKCK